MVCPEADCRSTQYRARRAVGGIFTNAATERHKHRSHPPGHGPGAVQHRCGSHEPFAAADLPAPAKRLNTDRGEQSLTPPARLLICQLWALQVRDQNRCSTPPDVSASECSNRSLATGRSWWSGKPGQPLGLRRASTACCNGHRATFGFPKVPHAKAQKSRQSRPFDAMRGCFKRNWLRRTASSRGC